MNMSTVFSFLQWKLASWDTTPVWLRPGLPAVGEAAPQALAMTPEKPVENAIKKAVQVETVHIRLPPDSLQHWAHVGAHNIQHLQKGGKKRLNQTRNEWW